MQTEPISKITNEKKDKALQQTLSYKKYFSRANKKKVLSLSLVLLLISNLTNRLRLHQFLVNKSAEANKSVKTDANGAH